MAGDTAAITAPIIAASNMLIPSNFGAISIAAIISKQAGIKHISIAGRPTFFKSLISKDNPALVSIITKANCLKSGDINIIFSSNKFKAWGLKIIPVKIIPMSLGNFSLSNILPINKPSKKITAKLVNIHTSLFLRRKNLLDLRHSVGESLHVVSCMTSLPLQSTTLFKIFLNTKKADNFCDKLITEVISIMCGLSQY